MITTNGIEECPCLHGALVKEMSTPFTGANGSFKEFDVAVGFPRTSLKVSRRKVLDHSICRHHFRSVARHFQPDSVKKMFKGDHEKKWTAWAWPRMTPTSKKKALKSMPHGY